MKKTGYTHTRRVLRRGQREQRVQAGAPSSRLDYKCPICKKWFSTYRNRHGIHQAHCERKRARRIVAQGESSRTHRVLPPTDPPFLPTDPSLSPPDSPLPPPDSPLPLPDSPLPLPDSPLPPPDSPLLLLDPLITEPPVLYPPTPVPLASGGSEHEQQTLVDRIPNAEDVFYTLPGMLGESSVLDETPASEASDCDHGEYLFPCTCSARTY